MQSILNWIENVARKLNVRVRLILAFTLVFAGITGLMGIYASYSMSDKVMETAQQKLTSDLSLGREIIDNYYPGDWQLKNGSLYKGDTLMEENYPIIDRIGELTGDTVTIFKHDTRVTTNVTQDGQRMINTKVSDEVAQVVLIEGKTFLGKAQVVGTWNECAYEPIKNKNGEIIGIWYVGVPATPYEVMINKFRINMIAYSIIGILIALCAAFLIAYTVHAPLRRIGLAINKASEGDLTQTVPSLANDEVGRLANRTNKMIEKMSELIRINKELTFNVGEASEQLLKRSEINASLMEDMASQAEEMNNNTNTQAELTNKSKVTIGEMTAVIQNVAENAQEVSTSAFSATNMAQDGGKQVDMAIKQIGIISNTVNSTANIIGDLGGKSLEIGQIVDLITNIASQTNLLALNAAIEAARAGEQGRGFAVVAEEVRKLAEESEEAAKRIALLIKQIQEEANKAVEAMQSGTAEVANGTEVVARAGEAFTNIILAVEKVNEQIQEMSAASQEMAASAETAIDSMEQTTATADSNVNLAKQISQMAEEQMAGSQEISASLDGMNSIVHELEKAIEYFKV
ncbi:MAG TPA: methyl-accepting chemotaxis protein [Syntrophomonadaceae bacterium]|nr:methyl-accepting chemotaxis protein [Syntrophomonadaceae bacterium]